MKLSIKIELNYHKFYPRLLIKVLSKKYHVLKMEKFGDSERKMTKLIDDFEEQITEYWENSTSILLKGKNRFFLLLETHSGIISGRGSINASSKKQFEMIKDLIKMIKAFDETGILLYASINSEELFDEKHKMVTYYKTGGSSYGWEGVSVWEFLNFLPGVYWFTVFGEDYVKAIGKEKILEIDDIEFLKFNTKAIAFYHRKNIQEATLDDFKNIEEKIGANYFFDQSRKIEELHHPPKFKALLKNIQQRYDDKYS